MKGFLATLLVLASTGMVNAQQSQRDFSSPDFNSQPSSGSSTVRERGSSFAPLTNQTRLAALQSDAREDRFRTNDLSPRRSSPNDLSDQYVIVDDRVDFQRQDNRQRPFFGPENDPRIRNAVQEQPRFIAQSSDRSETSVLPPSRNNLDPRDTPQSNGRFASDRTPDPFSIYDLEITPDLEYDLKRNGFLYAKTDRQQSLSDQLRLFGDRQRSADRSRESKIFASTVGTFQGNLVIDIDDYALEQIENGSYTLDGFNQFNAAGVILRYVNRDNSKIELTSSLIGQPTAEPIDQRDQRDLGRDLRRRSNSQTTDYRRDDIEGDGRFVLPTTDRDRRVTSASRNSNTVDRDRQNDRDIYDSAARRNYQDRMADIYRDDTRRPRDRIVDRRPASRYDDISYNDSDVEDSRGQNLLTQGQLEIERNLEQLRLMRRNLAAEAREIELRKQDLERQDLLADARGVGAQIPREQYPPLRSAGRDRLAGERDPFVSPRFADREFGATGITASPYLSDYATIPPAVQSDDPEFNRYVQQNEDQLSRIKKKMAAISQSSKLFALENDLDLKFQKQQLEQSAAKRTPGVGTVASFNDDGLVRGTLGGNLAARDNGYRYDRLVANTGSADAVYQRGISDLSMRSGHSNFPTPVQPPTTHSPSSSKKEQALWFIALLSIGMNIYLALLARTFYSRYNELADELRETFSASI